MAKGEEPNWVNEGHIVVGWRDWTKKRAFLEDIDVSDDCVEAIPGNPGFVRLYKRPLVRRVNSSELEQFWVFGNVRVESMDVKEPA